MRIGINFHTFDDFLSGVEYYAVGLINALLRNSPENEYVVFTNRPDIIRKYCTDSPKLSIRDVSFLKTRIQRIAWEHFMLPSIAKQERLDVLHCPSYISPAFKSSVPYVVTIHDTIAHDSPEFCKRTNAMYFRAFTEATVRNCSKIIAVSNYAAAGVVKNYPFGGAKLRVIHPGVDEIFHNHHSIAEQSEVRSRYNLPPLYILYVGNIEPKKNLTALLKAYRQAKEAGLPHKLVIAGKRTWKSGAVFREIRNGPYGDDIVLTGYVERDDLPIVYSMADVFVLTSLCEGFGFTPLEAMACGSPVICSGSGALSETIGDAAVIVDAARPEKIAEAIMAMSSDRNLRQEYRRRGKARSNAFRWEKAASEILSVYREAASK